MDSEYYRLEEVIEGPLKYLFELNENDIYTNYMEELSSADVGLDFSLFEGPLRDVYFKLHLRNLREKLLSKSSIDEEKPQQSKTAKIENKEEEE